MVETVRKPRFFIQPHDFRGFQQTVRAVSYTHLDVYKRQGCSHAALARAVVLYDEKSAPQKDDLHGKAPACAVIAARDGSCDLARWRPGDNGTLFSPQGGLRISARDLARIGRMLLNDGTLDGVRILQPASVALLATPVWQYNGNNGVIGEEDEPNRGGFFLSLIHI